MENRFNYKSLNELQQHIKELELDLPVADDLSILKKPITLHSGNVIPNRFCIQPMEGCDSLPDGSPSELTERRYVRFARGGSGLIWVEAVAACESGRGKPNQMFLHKGTVAQFKNLVEKIRKEAKDAHDISPFIVLQLTHAGRFGDNKKILYHYEPIDKAGKVPEDHPIMTDEELAKLEDEFVNASFLAKEAGFDSVDIKSCHRYLISENLGAHARDGEFGGSYENRTKLLKGIITRVKEEVDIHVTLRLNVYDGIPYPYGWGVDEQADIDLAEPKRLVRELTELGIDLINITAATPYYNPHVSRPYDMPISRGYRAPEHPLIGVTRMINLAKEIQQEIPDTVIVGTGYSWLRQFSPNVGAGVVKKGWSDIVGYGRMAFAYPDLAGDILENKEVKSSKVCISCSKCSELKAAAALTGCVVRDPTVYVEPYREVINKQKSTNK